MDPNPGHFLFFKLVFSSSIRPPCPSQFSSCCFLLQDALSFPPTDAATHHPLTLGLHLSATALMWTPCFSLCIFSPSFYFFNVYVYVPECIYVHPVPQKAREAIRSPGTLESQTIVSCLMLVLRSNLGFSARTPHALTAVRSPGPDLLFYWWMLYNFCVLISFHPLFKHFWLPIIES